MVDPGQQSNEPAAERLRQHATDVLCRHLTLEELLTTSDQWHLYSLASGYPYNSEKLKSTLIDRVLKAANRTGVEEAVRTCDKLLTDARERNLPGYELTFFTGIKLTQRWDLAPGLYTMPYRLLLQHFGMRRGRARDYFVIELDPKDEKSLSVLVSELRWGPIIVSSSGRTLKDPYPVEMKLTYDHNPMLLVALLAVNLNCPLSVVANTVKAAPWVEGFLGDYGGGGSYFDPGGGYFDPWQRGAVRKGTKVDPKNHKVAETALKHWDSFADANRNIMALAITRLSTSLSRTGTLAEQDRVLDISIALEILYQLRQSELTYKLSTRAGWYLGSETSERLQIRKTMSDLYSLRSAIVHGSQARTSDRDSAMYKRALDIARKTLLKHLSRKSMPGDQHWNELVMGDATPGGR